MRAEPKIVPRQALLEIRRSLRHVGKRVVFTNGCFDLLHVGHIRFLKEAKALGDILIVGVNCDASVQQIKGPGRLIIPDNERAEMLASLVCVNYVTLFAEWTPVELIAALQPDIHCKGGDYRWGKAIPERDVVTAYGGEVRILAYFQRHSTTALVHRIVRNKAREGQDSSA